LVKISKIVKTGFSRCIYRFHSFVFLF
jgi:hypothetical protein